MWCHIPEISCQHFLLLCVCLSVPIQQPSPGNIQYDELWTRASVLQFLAFSNGKSYRNMTFPPPFFKHVQELPHACFSSKCHTGKEQGGRAVGEWVEIATTAPSLSLTSGPPPSFQLNFCYFLHTKCKKQLSLRMPSRDSVRMCFFSCLPVGERRRRKHPQKTN